MPNPRSPLAAQIAKWVEDNFPEESILLADGFDEALIGVGTIFTDPPVAVYDSDKCIQILVERDGMSEEEAREHFEFNVVGAYVGDQTPMFLHRFNPEHDGFVIH